MDPETGVILAILLTGVVNFVLGVKVGGWGKRKEVRRMNAEQFEAINRQLAEIRQDSLGTREQIADLTLMLDDHQRPALRHTRTK
ncbi:MAG: hypothetical protein O3A46_05045 [Candidatus Poribacteria bacterium]|nr:hypothetical protein [Candidatus Poribacteria bacterium]